MPRLSIVIPCAQDAERFETTLASVLRNRPGDCELLVVQPQSYDDPYGLGDEVRFLEAPGDCSLVDMINIGIRCAEGLVVHILSCDVEVDDGWSEPALAHFSDPAMGSVSPLLVQAEASEQVVTRGVCYDAGGRRWNESKACGSGGHFSILGPTLMAGFYRRQAILDVGGFCADVGDQWADIDVALSLRAIGMRTLHEASSVVATPQNHPPRQRPSFRQGQQVERLFWRNASPFRWPQSILLHAGTIASELVSNLPRPAIFLQMLGRVLAVLETPTYRRHQRRLLSVRSARAADDDEKPEACRSVPRSLDCRRADRRAVA